MRFDPVRLCALVLAPLMLWGASPARAGRLESYGVRAGVSTSRLLGDFGEAIGGDYRSGIAAGVFWRFRLAHSIAFEPGISWVARGGDGKVQFRTSGPPTPAFELKIENRLQYLEFPLLVRLDLPATRAIRPYLIGGPAPAVRTGVKQVTESTTYTLPGATIPQLQYANIFEQVGTLGNQRVEKFDLGLVGGAGATLGSGHTRIAIEGRYTHGLLNVVEGGLESRNSGFAATLGVEFH